MPKTLLPAARSDAAVSPGNGSLMATDRDVKVLPISSLIPDLPGAEQLLPYLRRIDANHWYSNFGPLVADFESRLQQLLSRGENRADCRPIHLVTLASGHDALEIGLVLLGIASGKRVLMPAVTFTSTPLAALRTGAEIVFCDVDANSWTLTPKIARAVAAHIKIDAVLPVAVYGIPLPTHEWDAFTAETRIPVLMDAAAAIGTQVIPHRGLVAHSLHATKPLGIGEGGLLVGRDSELISYARRYSNFGMVNRICHAAGCNSKMSEYHAAVGLAQLDRWDEVQGRRASLLDIYRKSLRCLRHLASLHPSVDQAVVSCLMLLLRDPVAEAVVVTGNKQGIGFHRTYLPPLYYHPHFRHSLLVTADGASVPNDRAPQHTDVGLPNCETLKAGLVGLPFHPFMSADDVAITVDHLTSHLVRESQIA